MDVFTIPSRSELSMNNFKNHVAVPTDLSLCLGGSIEYQTKSVSDDNHPYVVAPDKNFRSVAANASDTSVRVVLSNKSITSLPKEMMYAVNFSQIIIGEFPQTVASKTLSEELTRLFNQKKLIETGKKYVLNIGFDVENKKYTYEENKEYFYKGKKYVLVEVSDAKNPIKKTVLSDGRTVCAGNLVWVEVQPVTFSRVRNKWLSDKLLITGIPFSFSSIEFEGPFEKSILYQYLNTFFIENLIPSALLKLHLAKKRELDETDKLIIISFLVNSPVSEVNETREQISTFGEEYLEYYDACWVNGDIERARVLSKIKNKGGIKF